MAFTDLPEYNMPIFISGVTIASIPIKDKINNNFGKGVLE